MSEKTQSSVSGLEADLQWRMRVFRTVVGVSIVGAVALIILFIFLGMSGTTIPTWTLVGVASTTLTASLVSWFLLRRKLLRPAVIVYAGTLTLTTFASVYLAGGVTGPMILFVMIFPVLAGLLGGGRTVWWNTGIVVLIWAILIVLEKTQIVQITRISGPIFEITHYAMFLSTLLLIAWMIGAFVRRSQQSLVLAYERERELVELNRLARQASQAEREARELASRSTAHLRNTVAGYRDYLARVNAGDYTARVDVGELDEQIEGDHELHALGEYLNATVARLVQALDEMQHVQRRYTVQTWRDLLRSGRVGRAFQYRQNQVEALQAVNWEQVRRAIADGAVVVDRDRVAMPVVVNRQVIGAVGGQHPDGRAWSEEELNLLSDVVSQLAQTVESLRLFDETQRSAAREQLTGEITARIRQSLDLDTILQTAAREVGLALDADVVEVRLGRGADERLGKRAVEELPE